MTDHSGHHAQSTDAERSRLLSVMQQHIGAAHGISAKDLAASVGSDERQVRRVISDLREDGYSICGTPGTGYFIASNAEELNACCEFLRSRALHSLRLEARLRNLALPDLIDQLRFVEV